MCWFVRITLDMLLISQQPCKDWHDDYLTSPTLLMTSSSWHHWFRPCINWIAHSWRNFSTICIKFGTNVVQTICSESQVMTERYVLKSNDVITFFSWLFYRRNGEEIWQFTAVRTNFSNNIGKHLYSKCHSDDKFHTSLIWRHYHGIIDFFHV